MVDDGSSDETDRVLSRYGDRIRMVSTINRGVSAARNLGIRLANAPLIALIDSDDEWLPGKLIEQVRFLEEHSSCALVQTEEIWIRHGRRVNPRNKHAKSDGDLFERSLQLCLISPSAVMLRRSLLSEVGGFDETLPACEDYDLWLRVTSRFPVGLIRKPLVIRYGGHDDQLSARHWGMDRFRVQSLANLLESNLLNRSQRVAAAHALARKSRILANGARKRGKTREVQRYESLLSRWSGLLLLALVLASTAALNACSDTPDHELMSDPYIVSIAEELGDQPDAIADYSDQQLLDRVDVERLEALQREFHEQGFHLRIIAISVKPHFGLGEFGFIFVHLVGISVDEVTIILSQVGLHAYVCFMDYRAIRGDSRAANAKLESDPTAAIEHLGEAILVHAAEHDQTRTRMLATSLVFCALFVTALLLARRSARRRGKSVRVSPKPRPASAREDSETGDVSPQSSEKL